MEGERTPGPTGADDLQSVNASEAASDELQPVEAVRADSAQREPFCGGGQRGEVGSGSHDHVQQSPEAVGVGGSDLYEPAPRPVSHQLREPVQRDRGTEIPGLSDGYPTAHRWHDRTDLSELP